MVLENLRLATRDYVGGETMNFHWKNSKMIASGGDVYHVLELKEMERGAQTFY